MLWLPLLFSVHLTTSLPIPARAVPAALRESVARLESRTISWERFESEQPRSRIPQWLRLERRIPSTRSGSADLAFTLAFYGVDYSRNLRRLLLPYRRWRRGTLHRPDAADRHDEAVVRDLPADLEILYRRHHDDASLGALLDLKRIEGFAETPEQALDHLWSDDPTPLLRLAAGHPARLRRLAEMLVEDAQNPVDRQELRTTLRALVRHREARVAHAARAVLRRVPATKAWPLNDEES